MRRRPSRRQGAGRTDRVDVSVVIVSWNVRDLLQACIESVVSTRSNLSVQVIVVDNASDDGSAELVREHYREIDLFASDTNLGFAAANNLGLANSQGRYVFFLNPDTVLREGALIAMINFLDREKQFGVVGPRLIDPDGSVQWVCARTFPTLMFILFEALYLYRLPFVGRRLKDRLVSPYDLSKRQEVHAISGAAMLGRREVIEQFGGFDESFLHTAEDVDLCLRLRRKGGRIFYLADAEVVHLGGQSTALASVRAATMGFISMGEYFRRSHGWLHALLYRLIVQVIQIPMLLLIGLGKAFVAGDLAELRWRSRVAKAAWTWRVAD
jgi:GT2 family glycosyltransferase